MTYLVNGSIMLVAYLLGSIPTAYLAGRHLLGVDIRTLGDGNMGARNVYHTLGARYAYFVAVADIIKGILPVLIAKLAGLTLGWQFTVGICTILGHDFPILARFRGGQGLATATGTMLMLFPWPTVAGLAAYVLIYCILKSSRIGAAVGGGLIALLLLFLQQWPQLIYAVAVLLFVPIKLFIDTPRRKVIATARPNKED